MVFQSAQYPIEALRSTATSCALSMRGSRLSQTSLPPITRRPTVLPNEPTNGLKASYAASVITSKTTGAHGSHLPNSATITRRTPLPDEAPSRQYTAFTLVGILQTSSQTFQKQRSSRVTWNAFGTRQRQPWNTTDPPSHFRAHPTKLGTGFTSLHLISKHVDPLKNSMRGRSDLLRSRKKYRLMRTVSRSLLQCAYTLSSTSTFYSRSTRTTNSTADKLRLHRSSRRKEKRNTRSNESSLGKKRRMDYGI